MPLPCIGGAMNNSERNQGSPHTQLKADPTISPSSSATQSTPGSYLKENSWKAAGRTDAIAPNPCRSVRSLMLLTISSCARCSSSARAGLNVTDMNFAQCKLATPGHPTVNRFAAERIRRIPAPAAQRTPSSRDPQPSSIDKGAIGQRFLSAATNASHAVRRRGLADAADQEEWGHEFTSESRSFGRGRIRIPVCDSFDWQPGTQGGDLASSAVEDGAAQHGEPGSRRV